MHAPSFRWEWNINTAAILVGFCSGFVLWGYTLAEMQSAQRLAASNITQINARIDALESGSRLLANHELRITTVERDTAATAAAMKAVEGSLNSLASDMRVTREILQRIEAAAARKAAQ